MKKLIYKDEVYFFKRKLCLEYESIYSSLKVYKKRESLLRFILPYKCIGYYSGSRKVASSDDKLVGLVKLYLNKEKESCETLVINYSPAVEDLYR